MDIIVNPQLVIHNLADAFLQKANGQLTSETMSALSTDELTLLAYVDFRREMLEGGMIQLIHNGYGPFIFENPFALVLKQWGLRDVAKIVYEGKKVYRESREEKRWCCPPRKMFRQWPSPPMEHFGWPPSLAP